MLKHMTLDAHTPQEQLTPETRRGLLRAFADRMLLKATAMDDPEDMPGIERAVRVAAVIERLYSRCDRAEGQPPDPRKLEADRARNTADAIQSRVSLAGTLQWGEKRRQDLGPWWDAAETASDTQTQALAHRARPAPGRGQACSHSGGPGTGSTYGPYSGCRPDATGTPDHRRKQDRSRRRHAPAPTRTGSRQSSRHDPVFPQDHANLRPPGHLCRLYRRHRKLAACPRL
ncbi:MAG: hypothetical protein WDN06_20240 [Asticcacaulis sp.]